MQGVNDVIDHLAAKLSIPAAHLWAVLVRQARIDGITNSVYVALYVVAAIVFARYFRRLCAWAEDEDEGAGVCVFILTVLVVALGGIALYCVFQIPGQFANPEYSALKAITDAIKK